MLLNGSQSLVTGEGDLGSIDIEHIDDIIDTSAAYIAPMLVLVLHNDQARNHMGINTVETTFITGLNGSGQKTARRLRPR